MSTEITCTKDYSIFKQLKANRDLRPRLVAKITKSMKKWGFDPTYPIKVNSKMEVSDGQHRLRVAMNLDLCVYYVIDDTMTIEKVHDFALAQERWTIDDYVSSFIRQGNEDYKRIAELRELSGLAWHPFFDALFKSGSDARVEIKEGKFNLSTHKEAEIIDFIEKFEIFKPLFKYWDRRAFSSAASQMFAHPSYNHEQMKKRLDWQSTKLVRCATVMDYLLMLQHIYNHKTEEKNRVDFTRRPR